MINRPLLVASEYYGEEHNDGTEESGESAPVDVTQSSGEENEYNVNQNCRLSTKATRSCKLDEVSAKDTEVNAAVALATFLALTVAILVILGVCLYLNNGSFDKVEFGWYLAVIGSSVLGLGTVLTVASCFFDKT
ncbi:MULTISPECIES: hypothetical protein [Candidatus Ichthyocystis]|uniref:Putative membrane protein n=1 Tax=Candidatus Ichthyocystis hellenicum TaxID=1561003 RepID=A0A0S4M2S1_9BURK|nr:MULTISPECIES: hypothetical protein [Ichthyocystis]CUT18069.1 putative membrane protein [Candidatus Ichthyocystis hellenicum]